MSNKGKRPADKSKIWVVAGAAVLAAIALISFSLRSAPEQAGPTAKSDATIGAVRNTHGRADAKVVLVEYGDYL